jgi:hypothetical protein
MSDRRTSRFTLFLLIALVATLLASAAPTHAQATRSYLVQARSAAQASGLVRSAGGVVTRDLGIINSVAASLTPLALSRLQANPQVTLYADTQVRTADDKTVGGAGTAAGGDDATPGSAPNTEEGEPPAAQSEPENTQIDGSDMSGSLKETNTAGYLLYPSAATGAAQVRFPKNSQVATQNQRCQNGRVSNQGGTKDRSLLGWGVTVAVIDSGFMPFQNANYWDAYDPSTRTLYAENGEGRCLVYRDFVAPESDFMRSDRYGRPNSSDPYGHGTHVISTIADNRRVQLAKSSSTTQVGVAPKVNLLVARALGRDGSGTYSDVIAAIDWVVQNKDTYKVRVLNLSLYSPVQGPYWADPLNQAVMKAWQAGIVVVVAAGNSGPDAGTITAPGNVPYVITVGAIKSGRYTASHEDELASYSSRGPTESAFIKPDVLIPASRTIAPMPNDSVLAQQLRQLCNGTAAEQPCVPTHGLADYGFGGAYSNQGYYYLSGTSMAAAEVSGVAALLIQANPQLSNNQVKLRLMTSAKVNIDAATQQPTYTPWEQGAGLVDLRAALQSTENGQANQGMDIGLDLVTNTDPQTHYWGMTIWDAQAKEFRLLDPDTGRVIAIWSGTTRTWAGTTRTWAGSTRTWAGTTRTWAGTTRTWAGSTRTWAGSDALWAGSQRSWADETDPIPLSASTHAGLVQNP